jgi:hypothetical protein
MKEHIEEQEFAWLAGGELEIGESPDLMRHLSQCRACAAKLGDYQEDRRALAKLRDAGIYAGDFDLLRHEVMNRLQDRKIVRFPVLSRWSAFATLVLISAALGVLWWRHVPIQQTSSNSKSEAPAQIKPPAIQSGPRVDRAAEVTSNQTGTTQDVFIPESAAIAPSQEVIDITGAPSIPTSPVSEQDDVVMKFETSDPNVIILWLESPKGAER